MSPECRWCLIFAPSQKQEDISLYLATISKLRELYWEKLHAFGLVVNLVNRFVFKVVTPDVTSEELT